MINAFIPFLTAMLTQSPLFQAAMGSTYVPPLQTPDPPMNTTFPATITPSTSATSTTTNSKEKPLSLPPRVSSTQYIENVLASDDEMDTNENKNISELPEYTSDHEA